MKVPKNTKNRFPTLPGTYVNKTIIQKDTHTPVFIAALFTTAKTWRWRECPQTDEPVEKVWCMYPMGYTQPWKRWKKAICNNTVIAVQLLSCIWLFATPWTAARQSSLSITNSGAYTNSCPLCQWCHPTISSSVNTFSSHLQSFPASGSFSMSPFFASGSQSIGASASELVLPIFRANFL